MSYMHQQVNILSSRIKTYSQTINEDLKSVKVDVKM